MVELYLFIYLDIYIYIYVYIDIDIFVCASTYMGRPTRAHWYLRLLYYDDSPSESAHSVEVLEPAECGLPIGDYLIIRFGESVV